MSIIFPAKQQTILQPTYVPPIVVNVKLKKETIQENISLLMTECGVQTFGYLKNNDDYWGYLKQTKTTTRFTLTLQKISDSETALTIHTINGSQQDITKIIIKICDTIKLFETSPSIYKKKYISVM